MILTDEFSRQASMEQDLGIPSALYAAPVREVVELGKSQIGFMNMFAIPLFQGVTDVMPGMEFAVDELHRNKSAWEDKIQEEQAKARQDSDDSVTMDGVFSPRTMSVATSSAASHHKTNTTPSTARSSNDSEFRIKAMLNKSPFSPPNGVLDESTESADHPALHRFSTISPTDSNPSHNKVVPDSRRFSKPSQLQLVSQNAYLLDHQGKDALLSGDNEYAADTGAVKSSLTTDPVTITSLDQRVNGTATNEQRTSNTTEGSASAGGESNSQATSATTNKMPISPSSRGTSIRSDISLEKYHTPTAAGTVPFHPTPEPASATSTAGNGSPDESPGRHDTHEGKIALMGTVRNLRKKPSRFRVNSLNFWKRNKSESPPMPAEVPGDKSTVGSEDEGSQWSSSAHCL
jgi:3',5'-cyclic-nucleotide phosphodiesterase